MNDKPLIEYYRKNFARHGVSEESLGWTKGKQEIRFHQLTRYFFLSGCSLIDIGCGFGDLISYLDKRGISPKAYVGYDLVKEFLDVASRKHAGQSVSFFEQNYLDVSSVKADYIVGSGLFGRRLSDSEQDNYDYFRKILAKAFSEASEGVAFDFLSDRVQFRRSQNDFHASPVIVLSIAYEFTNNLIIDNSAMPFEFSVILFKNDKFSPEKTVFDRFLTSWSL